MIMMGIRIFLMVVGALVVFGAIGQSDYETIVLQKEITPFWQLRLWAITGLVLVIIGLILPNRKEVKNGIREMDPKMDPKRIGLP